METGRAVVSTERLLAYVTCRFQLDLSNRPVRMTVRPVAHITKAATVRPEAPLAVSAYELYMFTSHIRHDKEHLQVLLSEVR